MELNLLITGSTAEQSANRVRSIIQGANQRGATAYVRTQPIVKPDLTRDSKYSLSILWPLALWGIHHSQGGVSASAMVRRLGCQTAHAQLHLVANRKAGSLQFNGELPRKGRGNLAKTYSLTPSGLEQAQGWVTRVLNGHLMTIAMPKSPTARAGTQQWLDDLPGVVIANPSSPSTPAPYDTVTLVLMLCWVYQQGNRPVWANALTKPLHLKSSSRVLWELADAGCLKPDQRSGRVQYYLLTTVGEQIAYGYLRTILL